MNKKEIMSKVEESWDGEDARRKLNANVFKIAGISVAALVLYGIYSSITSIPTSDDAKLSFIKRDYEQAMSEIQEIEDSGDEMEIALANEVKAKIYLTPNSGFYDELEGFNVLSDIYNESKSVEVASKLYDLATKLRKGIKTRALYLEYLSSRSVGDSSNQLIDLYLSSARSNERVKALPMLQAMPESVSRNIKLAKYLIADKGDKDSLFKAERLLITASSLGSSEAEAELATTYIKILQTNPSNASDIVSRFASSASQSISMGYRGAKLKDFYNIFFNGGYGVSPNRVLALKIKGLIGESNDVNN